MTEKTAAERIKGMQVLSEALDAQRKQTEETCAAATAEMHTAWVAGRNADRRIVTKKREPDRRQG